MAKLRTPRRLSREWPISLSAESLYRTCLVIGWPVNRRNKAFAFGCRGFWPTPPSKVEGSRSTSFEAHRCCAAFFRAKAFCVKGAGRTNVQLQKSWAGCRNRRRCGDVAGILEQASRNLAPGKGPARHLTTTRPRPPYPCKVSRGALQHANDARFLPRAKLD